MTLVPQDLVWVDGKSSSWRNPEEIEELKGLVAVPNSTGSVPLSRLRQGAFAFRSVSAVCLPDHRDAGHEDRWPPTLAVHFIDSGLETLLAHSMGADMPSGDYLKVDYPVVIARGFEGEDALVTVKLVPESGYTGRGRRKPEGAAVQLTPVFERSVDMEERSIPQRIKETRRISIEFMMDGDDAAVDVAS